MTMFCSSSPMSISARDREFRRVLASSSELVFKIILAQCSRISSAVSSKTVAYTTLTPPTLLRVASPECGERGYYK